MTASRTDPDFDKDLAFAGENLARLISAVGGVEEAAKIAGTSVKRIQAAMDGDLSKVNPLQVSALEQRVGHSLFFEPWVARMDARRRARLPTPSVKEVQIAASANLLAAAEASHQALLLPEKPSPKQLEALRRTLMKAQTAASHAADLRIVFDERSGA